MTFSALVRIDYTAVGRHLLDHYVDPLTDAPLDPDNRDQRMLTFFNCTKVLKEHVDQLMDESKYDPDPVLTEILLTHQLPMGVIESIRVSEHIGFVMAEEDLPRYYLPLILIKVNF